MVYCPLEVLDKEKIMPDIQDLKARGNHFYFVVRYLSFLLRDNEVSHDNIYRFAAVASFGILKTYR